MCRINTVNWGQVVDAPNFLSLYASKQEIAERPDLCTEDAEEVSDRSRANMACIRQSRPDSGHI